MGRKLIIVPKTKQAEIRLDYDKALEDELHTISMSHVDYYNFWTNDLVDSLNEECEIMIGDYEYEEIIGIENIKQAIQILQSFEKSKDKVVFKNIIEIFKKAIKNQTGVYLYF